MAKVRSANLFISIVMLSLMLLYVNTIYASDDNKGTEFYVSFLENYEGSLELSFFIASDETTTGDVILSDTGETIPFSVTANDITKVSVPERIMLSGTGIQDKGIKIVADKEVSVIGLSRKQATTDAFMALPIDVLGNEYYLLTYGNTSVHSEAQDEFSIVATEDNTSITIDIPNTNDDITIILSAGQAYQNQKSGAGDWFSGTHITSTKPIAVFGGNKCTNIPLDEDVLACDHVVEQIFPLDIWSKEYAAAPLATRTRGDTFRILASQDNTEVTINGVVATTLSTAGSFYETILSEVSLIAANKPILVAQYSNSSSYDGVTSDPFMALLPPLDQYNSSYFINTPDGFTDFINLIVPTDSINELYLDGNKVSSTIFSAIPGTDFSGGGLQIESGKHHLTGKNEFGVMGYGFASYDSYGYPAGLTTYRINADIALADPQKDRAIFQQFKQFAKDSNDDIYALLKDGDIYTTKALVADGITRGVVRFKTSEPGTVTFSLDGGAKNGALSTVHGWYHDALLPSLEQTTREINDEYYTFAVYTVPHDLYQQEGEKNTIAKKVKLSIAFEADSSPGTTINKELDIILLRRPTFISHGLWSNSNEMERIRDHVWESYTDKDDFSKADSIVTRNDLLFLIDYENLNADLFTVSNQFVRDLVRTHFEKLRNQLNIAVNQANWIGHSMGGIQGRLTQTTENNLLNDYPEFPHEILKKIITVDTPHHNAFTADIIINVRDGADEIDYPCGFKDWKVVECNAGEKLRQVARDSGHSIDGGAIDDLATAGLPHTNTNAFAIIGDSFRDLAETDELHTPLCYARTHQDELTGALQTTGIWVERLEKWLEDFDCARPFGFDARIPDGDIIVEIDSQRGGLGNTNTFLEAHAHTNLNGEGLNLSNLEGPFDKESVNNRITTLLATFDQSEFANAFPVFDGSPVRQARMASKLKRQVMTRNQKVSTSNHDDILLVTPERSTVSEGEVITFRAQLLDADAPFEVNIESVTFVSMEGAKTANSTPFEATVTVPVGITEFILNTYASLDYQNVELHKRIVFDVTTSAILTGILSSVDSIVINKNRQVQLQMTGQYDDGIERNITLAKSGTIYEAIIPGVISISENGLLTAIGFGSTDLVITNANITKIVNITVRKLPPIARPGADQVVIMGDRVIFDGSRSEGDIVSYTWKQLTGDKINFDTNSSQLTFTAPSVTRKKSFMFELKVQDSDDKISSNSATVQVVSPSSSSSNSFPWPMFLPAITGGNR